MSTHDVLWITDAWSMLHPTAETTLRLLSAAHHQGFAGAWADVGSIHWNGDATCVEARHVVSAPSSARDSIELMPAVPERVSDFRRIFYRPDLVTRATRHALELVCIELEARGRNPDDVVVNAPSALFGANEKLAAASFAAHTPRTVVSAREKDLVQFGKKLGMVVLKPLHLHQSQGIERLCFDDTLAMPEILDALRRATDGFQVPVVLQEFLPAFATGEKRLWFVEGELVGWARKNRHVSVFPLDMDRNGSLVSCNLEAKENETAAQLSTWLRAHRVALAGVDCVGGLVTDVNFVSPGLLMEVESAMNVDLASSICERLLRSTSSARR